MYEKNVNRQFDIFEEEARSNQLRQKLMVESGNPFTALAAMLMDNGHGPTGPGGLYGCNALSAFTRPVEPMPGRQVALDFGKAVLKKSKRLRVLFNTPLTRINFYSSIVVQLKSYEMYTVIEPEICTDPKLRAEYVHELVDDCLRIISKKSFEKWALGALTFKKEYRRDGFEGWGASGNTSVRLKALFQFQSVLCNTCPAGPVNKRTLKYDALADQHRRDRQIIEEFNEATKHL